jgi:hypothetical protein
MEGVLTMQTKLEKYMGVIAGTGVTLFSIAYLFGTVFIRRTKFVAIGAEFMPKIYGAILLLLGVLLIYEGVKSMRARTDTEDEAAAEPTDTKNVLMTLLLIFIYVASMKWLGFILSSSAFLFLMTLLLTPSGEKKNYLSRIIFSVVLSVGTYYVFHEFMYISLPAGAILKALF